MVVFGDVPRIAAVLINAALVAYLALFVVIFSMVMARLTAATGPRALLVAPIVWVATELGRTYLLTGFPWVLLGYSQVTRVADRPAGQRVRSVRSLSARRERQRGACIRRTGWRFVVRPSDSERRRHKNRVHAAGGHARICGDDGHLGQSSNSKCGTSDERRSDPRRASPRQR